MWRLISTLFGSGDVRVLHIPMTSQFADIFTKGLPTSVFTEFRSSLNVWAPDDSTTGRVRLHSKYECTCLVSCVVLLSFLRCVFCILH
jgi:hypothetical protein